MSARMRVRASLGVGIIALLLILIGGLLSVHERNQEWMAQRLDVAQRADGSERVVEGTVVALSDIRLRTPFGGQDAVAFRSWLQVDTPPQPIFRNADQQLFAPWGVRTRRGETLRVELETYTLQRVNGVSRVRPVEGTGEVILGAPTFKEDIDRVERREIALKEGDTVTLIGDRGSDDRGRPILKGAVQVFHGPLEAWTAQAQRKGDTGQGLRTFGLVLMALGGLLILAIIAFNIAKLFQREAPTST